MDERARRIAENESLFRDLNEEVGAVAHSFSPRGETGTYDFLCECADPTCTARVSLQLPLYEQVRASPVRFFVVPGHELPDVELVVETHPAYTIVEKAGESASIARERDPRN
jgi:hypothetical protein